MKVISLRIHFLAILASAITLLPSAAVSAPDSNENLETYPIKYSSNSSFSIILGGFNGKPRFGLQNDLGVNESITTQNMASSEKKQKVNGHQSASEFAENLLADLLILKAYPDCLSTVEETSPPKEVFDPRQPVQNNSQTCSGYRNLYFSAFAKSINHEKYKHYYCHSKDQSIPCISPDQYWQRNNVNFGHNGADEFQKAKLHAQFVKEEKEAFDKFVVDLELPQSAYVIERGILEAYNFESSSHSLTLLSPIANGTLELLAEGSSKDLAAALSGSGVTKSFQISPEEAEALSKRFYPQPVRVYLLYRIELMGIRYINKDRGLGSEKDLKEGKLSDRQLFKLGYVLDSNAVEIYSDSALTKKIGIVDL